MKGFKEIAVLTNVYEMGKGKSVSVKELVGDPLLKDRIFGLLDANKRNADYKNKRRWIDIRWEETAVLQLEAGNTDWIEYALEVKRLECRRLKKDIDFPVKDSYVEALQDLDAGETLKKSNDYITIVEEQIIILEGIEFKPKAKEIEGNLSDTLEVGTIEYLKAIIKEKDLGIRVAKTDSYEDVEGKIFNAIEDK